MEQEVSNFKSIRAKFQEEILAKSRPVLPEKPKRLPTAPFGRSGLMTISSSPTLETKTPGLPRVIHREDQKVPFGKRPVSFPIFPHTTPEDGGNRHSQKIRHLPLVLPPSSEVKHDPAALASKRITSPLKCIKKPMPAPFKPCKMSLCGKDGPDHVKNGSAEESAIKALNTEFVEIHQTRLSNPASQCPSPEHPSASSPNESLTEASPRSVTQFFDQHVFSTLEKAKKKLYHKNLLACGRPKSFCPNKGVTATESPPSPIESDRSHAETVFLSRVRCPSNSVPVYASTSPLKVHKTSPSAITHTKLNGVAHLERDQSRVRKPLPDLATLGTSPLKPPRPPHVNLSRYQIQGHGKKCEPESEILANRNGLLEDATLPPPKFPDFDTSAPIAKYGNIVNIASLELEGTAFPDTCSLPPPPPVPDDNDAVHFETQHTPSHVALQNMWSGDGLEEKRNGEILSNLPLEPMIAEVEVNGSDAANTSCSEQQLPSDSNSCHQEHIHETCDNLYEDVEAVPKFPFSQNSRKRKGPPKNPYADNGHVKEEVRKNIWHITQWSSSEDQNGQTQPDKKEQLSPEHHGEKDHKKKEKQRLERQKKEQKEKEKKRNEMHKKFKITGQEEPMYHARVLVASKLRKHDLPVKSGDVISIIRTVNCPKGKWLARDANYKYGYISVMNVELNIKEMLELGKKASQSAGRGQTDGDNLSFSSRSSHQNPALTSSFTDDSEEWTCDEETQSPSADNLSQNRAVSMPDIFYSNLSSHHTVSDGSTEDMSTQNEALQKLAVFFQNGNENLINTTENGLPIPNTGDASFLSAVGEPPYLESEDFQFADVDLLPPPALYADSQ